MRRNLFLRIHVGWPPLSLLHSSSSTCWRAVSLTLAGNVDEHYGILRTVQRSLLLFVPFLIFAALSGGYLLSGQALLPVGRMTVVAIRLSLSNLHGRVTVPQTQDELQLLAEAWNNMLSRLEASVERTSQFSSDASHDLRMSVAVILASSQLALRKERSVGEYRNTLRTLTLECEHMLSMIEKMLVAARSGFESYCLVREPTELAALIRERCLLFAAEAEIKNQSFILDLIPEAWICGDRSLLLRLIGSLVDNAIKYTRPGGSINVHLAMLRSGFVLQVQDTGEGISPADLPGFSVGTFVQMLIRG